MNASNRSFDVTLDDADRLMVLTALGFASMHMVIASAPLDMRRPIDALIRRLSSAPGQDAPPSNSGTEAARAVLAPPPSAQPRTASYLDHFMHNKKGEVLTGPPEGAELSNVTVVSAVQGRGKEYLTVIFAAGHTADGVVRPAGKANCFDKSLWAPIKNREGQVASLWIQESGNYLNIVGVRA